MTRQSMPQLMVGYHKHVHVAHARYDALDVAQVWIGLVSDNGEQATKVARGCERCIDDIHAAAVAKLDPPCHCIGCGVKHSEECHWTTPAILHGLGTMSIEQRSTGSIPCLL